MRSTFGNLVDRLAVRLNESKIPEGRFDNVVGVHAAMKEAILDGVRDILHERIKWPFLAVEQTQVLDDGTNEYAWPLDFDSVDWNSFQVQADNELGIHATYLPVIQREEWYRRFRDIDYDKRPQGLQVPRYVFAAHGMGFGIAPAPDRDYTVKYRYFKYPTLPEARTDQVPIPNKHDHVILAAALKNMYSFLDNTERATFWQAEYIRLFNAMVRVELGQNLNHMYAGVLNRPSAAENSIIN